jgi:hypothetical protein
MHLPVFSIPHSVGVLGILGTLGVLDNLDHLIRDSREGDMEV